MTISIRLDDQTEAELRRRLRRDGIPLSSFVREAILEKLDLEDGGESAYELGRGLFGRYASGQTDRSTQRKRIIRERLSGKRRR